MITADRLRQLVVYDPVGGTFIRNGKAAGTVKADGYANKDIEVEPNVNKDVEAKLVKAPSRTPRPQGSIHKDLEGF